MSWDTSLVMELLSDLSKELVTMEEIFPLMNLKRY
jgi:hypothetical protein